jgi:hypothetical protein
LRKIHSSRAARKIHLEFPKQSRLGSPNELDSLA